MTITLEELIKSGVIWIEDGDYVARDSDGVVCSLALVGYHEDAFRKAIVEGYGDFNKKD